MKHASCDSRRILAIALMGCLPCSAAVVGAEPAMETPAVVYTLDAHVLASGTSVTSRNACHRLRATIAEPVVGLATNADYALSAGFRATPSAQSGDDIFSGGFEVCP